MSTLMAQDENWVINPKCGEPSIKPWLMTKVETRFLAPERTTSELVYLVMNHNSAAARPDLK